MSIRGLCDKIETFCVVTLITCLVWLYAEGENLVQYSQPVRVRFVGPVGTDLAITPRELINVDITFRASKSQLADLNALVAKGPI